VDLRGEYEFLAASSQRIERDLEAALGITKADVQAPARGEIPRPGYTFRKRFVDVLGAVDEILTQVSVAFVDGTDASDFQQRQALGKARKALTLLNALQEMRPWLTLEGPRAEVFPGVVAFLASASRAVLRTPADVIAFPDREYGYSAVREPLAETVALARERAAEGGNTSTDDSDGVNQEPMPIVVNFPLQEAPSLFLHVLAVHELAHGADERYGIASSVAASYRLTATESDRDEKLLALQGIEDAAERADYLQRLEDLRKVWLVEAVCDAIALAYTGPVYLLAFAAFTLQAPELLSNMKHPATRVRINLLLSHARDLGWSKCLEEWLTPLDDWLTDVTERLPAKHAQTEPFMSVERSLLARGDALRKAVVNHLGTDVLQVDEHLRQVHEIMEYLRLRILPVDPDGVFDPRAVITAGWLWRLHAPPPGVPEAKEASPGDFPLSRIVEAVADADTQAFLAKAIELRAVDQEWRALTHGKADSSAGETK
jgi:hypothetical protein